jgi:hypothetical protein
LENNYKPSTFSITFKNKKKVKNFRFFHLSMNQNRQEKGKDKKIFTKYMRMWARINDTI